MEIVDILKNFLSSEQSETLIPIINALRQNSFNLKKTFQSLTPEMLAPLARAIAQSGFNSAGKTAPARDKSQGATAVANVADKEIVYALNRYVSANSAI
ncbi:MAG: hypothetical protein IJU83_01740 [Clostridia bacterium]|nr:hypothetical protein [Clostridia bacterium]